MKRLVYTIMTLMLLSLTILSGCGGGGGGNNGGGGNDGGAGPYTVTINVYDADKNPLNDVELKILETGVNETINSSHRIVLNRGTYTVYISKDGWITSGFVFNLTSSLTLNVKLINTETEVDFRFSISGVVKEENMDFNGPFKLLAGNVSDTKRPKDDVLCYNPFTLDSVISGNIVISAYTLINNQINKIAYLRKELFSDLTDLELNFPSNTSAITYSGTKPSSDGLSVKLRDGYCLAEQGSATTDYSFKIQPNSKDEIILEIYRSDDGVNYLTRVNAGKTGGTNNLHHQSGVPNPTITSDDDNYLVNIDFQSYATHYEVYAMQIEDKFVPLASIVLSGTTLKIPKDFIDGSNNTILYVRAVKLSNYNVAAILRGVQDYSSYSYIEKKVTIDASAGAATLLSVSRFKDTMAIEEWLRTKYKLNHLLSER